jgi:hypothetical protein
LEYLRPMNKGKGFCWILNRSRKDFQLGVTLFTDERGEIFIRKGLVNRRCIEHFEWLLNPEEHKPQQCINTVELVRIPEIFSNRSKLAFRWLRNNEDARTYFIQVEIIKITRSEITKIL